MQLITVKIEKPDDTDFILGQTHFIKSVEDIHEALVGVVPGIKFGPAFCEASGKCLVRRSVTHPAMTELAKKNATAIGAGQSFLVFLGDGFYLLKQFGNKYLAYKQNVQRWIPRLKPWKGGQQEAKNQGGSDGFLDVAGSNRAEFMMKTSSEETWMKAANSGFSRPNAANRPHENPFPPRLAVGPWRRQANVPRPARPRHHQPEVA